MTHNVKLTTQANKQSRCFALRSNDLLCLSSGKPKALDLFCAAGGASYGLHKAGFDVTGVDIKPQKSYPFKFRLADALAFPLEGYDLIWASPPCQRFSEQTAEHCREKHPNLIPAIRARLKASGKPYIIENVGGARFELNSPVKLCGSMFGLPIERHRYFEIGNCGVYFLTPPCQHIENPVLITGTTQKRDADGRRLKESSTQERRDAMQIQWMSRLELDQAIPPAYSEFLARTIFAQNLNVKHLAA